MPAISSFRRTAARVLSLPMYPELTAEETDRVIEAIKTWDSKRAEKSTGAAARR